MKLILLTVLIVGAVVAADNAQKPFVAVAYVEGGNGKIQGNVTFTQKACGENVYIDVSVIGLTEGLHGFHIHEKGDLTNGCTSMAGHYNPDKVDHAGPKDEVRHVGDLGNIEANKAGEVKTVITDHVISLVGARSIVGRGVVIHSDPDDLGKTDHPDSKKTGNAGSRVACGVIGIKEPSEGDWPSSANKMKIFGFPQILILPLLYYILSFYKI